MAKKAEAQPQTISVGQAAALLNMSVRFVQQLTKEGYITRVANGKYSLVGVVHGAMAYYQAMLERSNKAAAANRATDARTREIELRIAEREGRLISLDGAEMVGQGARITRDRELRRKIDADNDAALERMARRAERTCRALETGTGLLEAVAEDQSGGMGGE
jgi:hypothetical protein